MVFSHTRGTASYIPAWKDQAECVQLLIDVKAKADVDKTSMVNETTTQHRRLLQASVTKRFSIQRLLFIMKHNIYFNSKRWNILQY